VLDRHAEELQQEKNDRAADKQMCVVLNCTPLASCSLLERKWTCSYWATLCAALFVFVLTFTIVIITTATNHKHDHHHDDDHQLTNQHNHVLALLLLHHLVSSVLDRHAEELQQEKNDRAADMETCVVLDCFGAQIICFLPFALKANPRSEKHCVLFFFFFITAITILIITPPPLLQPPLLLPPPTTTTTDHHQHNRHHNRHRYNSFSLTTLLNHIVPF
jgi:hypothetical protein